MESVKIRIRVIVTRGDCDENIFILSWVVSWNVIEVEVDSRSRGAHLFLFFILFTSFGDRDEAYMNKVIIPDENVRMRMNGSHLLFNVWYSGFVDKIE